MGAGRSSECNYLNKLKSTKLPGPVWRAVDEKDPEEESKEGGDEDDHDEED